MLRFTSRLLERRALTPTVGHFVFQAPAVWSFEPGQFLTVRFTGSAGSILKRSYSIASPQTLRGRFELCVKFVENGEGTRFFRGLSVGDEATFQGPLGAFTVKDGSRPMTFISTGAGLAPFRSMITSVLAAGGSSPVTLLEGYRNEEEVLYPEWKKELASNSRFSSHTIISRPQQEGTAKGYVHALIDEHVKETDQDFYICGLRAMIEEATARLLKKGVDAETIFFERYD